MLECIAGGLLFTPIAAALYSRDVHKFMRHSLPS